METFIKSPVSIEMLETPKRGRGRPRKHPIHETSVTRRPRGRPPKKHHEGEIIVKKLPDYLPRPRGRPRKEVIEIKIKRPRGRPRLYEPKEVIPGRPRGRPRIHPQRDPNRPKLPRGRPPKSSSNEDVSSGEAEYLTRSRGRPRKERPTIELPKRPRGRPPLNTKKADSIDLISLAPEMSENAGTSFERNDNDEKPIQSNSSTAGRMIPLQDSSNVPISNVYVDDQHESLLNKNQEIKQALEGQINGMTNIKEDNLNVTDSLATFITSKSSKRETTSAFTSSSSSTPKSYPEKAFEFYAKCILSKQEKERKSKIVYHRNNKD